MDHYKILGLKEGASQEQIKTAYSKLSKELNPANNDNQEFFIEEYEKVRAAYKALYNNSILATEEAAKSIKVLKNNIPNNKSKLNSETQISLRSIKIKQNIIAAFLIASLGFNFYLFQQIKGDNNAVTVSKSYASEAEDYSSNAYSSANNAEDYMTQAEDYSSNAYSSASNAEDYMNQAGAYMNQAEEYMNNAYYYSQD